MNNFSNSPAEQHIESFYGSVEDMVRQITSMDDDNSVWIAAIAAPGITRRDALRLSKLFKNSSAVHQYLSAATDVGFYKSFINARLPKTVPMPRMLIDAKTQNAAKIAQIKRGDFLTLKQLSGVAQLFPRSPKVLTRKWQRDRTIFSFDHNGLEYFPAYALIAENILSPNPIIAKTLEIFKTSKTGWDCALWFATPNEILKALRPKDILKTNPDNVIAAAHAEM